VYAVVDTCVLVSGLRSSSGASHEILRAVRSGELEIAISVALAIEYESVVLRPGLVPALGISEIQVVVDVLCKLARHQKIFYTWRPFLPDPAAAGCPYIITHNISDFRGSDSMGIQAVTPAQALPMI
jgi:hypothetical protein